jgi:hypothetical protein
MYTGEAVGQYRKAARRGVMFSYSDPTGSGFLEQTGALQTYREMVDFFHQQFHRLERSAFTLREAFDELAGGAAAASTRIEWKAFPVTAAATPKEIDRRRFDFQDEYVEWRVETKPDGTLARVTFTTEFPQYFQALAKLGAAPLKEEVIRLHAGSNPTDGDLFGAGFNPATASPQSRADRFLAHLRNNP